jgi:hypothetical protein
MDMEEVWRIREEEIYPTLFGSESRGIFALTANIFIERFSAKTYDPRWLTYGILEYAPTPARPCWIYATSAYSNPWEQEPQEYDPDSESGSGIEFLFASTEQGDWAIRFLLHMLAFDLLLSAGHFGERPPLGEGDRVPLHSPINGRESSLIRNAIVCVPEELPKGFALPSGKVGFFTFNGVTDAEIDFAKQTDTDDLIQHLIVAGHYPATDPGRPSLF